MVQILIWLLFLSFSWGNVCLAVKVGVIRNNTAALKQVAEGIRLDLGDSHSTVDMLVGSKSTVKDLYSFWKRNRPSIFVLLDNKAVNLARLLYQKYPKTRRTFAVAAMGLNFQHILKGNQDIGGVAFEVPAFTIVTQFQIAVGRKLKRVLTLYRGSQFKKYISDAKRQLAGEGVELLAIDVELAGKNEAQIEKFITKYLVTQIGKKKINSVLIVADNQLLKPNLLEKYWLPRAKAFQVPFLCGVRELVSEDLEFCSFAAYPNQSDISQQVVDILLRILEDGESPASIGVEYILSINKVMDEDRIEELGYTVSPGARSGIEFLN